MTDMCSQGPACQSSPVLAPFDPTGQDSAHQRCYESYLAHAACLVTAQVGNGLGMADVEAFRSSVRPCSHLDTAPSNATSGEAVWVDPARFVATRSFMDGWPSARYGVGGFYAITLQAGLAEHCTHQLFDDCMHPNEIEMSIHDGEIYMRLGAGGRHRWAAWKLLGFPAVPVVLVS